MARVTESLSEILDREHNRPLSDVPKTGDNSRILAAVVR
jgi:hypothetical protein